MSRKEVEFVRSEVATLEGFLQSMAPARIIERMGLESRLEAARSKLAELETQPFAKPLPITFRGAPVDGSRSIDAGFAATALKSFIEATNTVAASLSAEELRRKGPLPQTNTRSLRIVDTALGSFGFELELPPPLPDEPSQTELDLGAEPAPDPYEQAIETTFDLIMRAAAQDETEVSSLVAEIHPRAAAKVRAFVKVLADAHALVAAEFEGRRIQLDDDATIQRVLEALHEGEITERTEAVRGVLLGVLPHSRRFECEVDGRVVAGKVDRSIADIGVFEDRWKGRLAMLELWIVSVRRKEAFVLVGASDVGTSP